MNKIVLLTNILTPYRVYFYRLLFDEFKKQKANFEVWVCAETEPNRNWLYRDFKQPFTKLLNGNHYTVKNGIFIHYNPCVEKMIQEVNPSIIVSAGTYLFPTLWKVLKLKNKYNYKVLYWNESHEHEKRNYDPVKLYVREFIRKKIFKEFDGYWYAGEWALEMLSKYAKKNSTLIFVPNLIDENEFKKSLQIDEDTKNEILKELGLTSDKIIMICPARLTIVKGQLDFFKMFVECVDANKFTILLAGDGELEDNIRFFLQQWKNIEVKFLGYRTQNEMIALYGISDILLLPSLSDPNPLTCIESLWCGLPLLLSNHVGNSPEVVSPGKNGFVFSYEEKKTFNDIISCIAAKDHSWYEKAQKISLDIAEDKYNSIKNTERIVKETLRCITGK